MKKFIFLIIFFLILFGFLSSTKKNNYSLPNQPHSQTANNSTQNNPDIPRTTVIAQDLDTPWGIVFLPDNTMLVTERPGTVRLINNDGTNVISTIKNVKEFGEGGLLGITIHPNFSSNHYVYLYYTYSNNGTNTLNRVVRMTYDNKTLADEKVIVDQIPGASNHNGGRIKFGPDNYLYVTTGDAENPSQAQNTNALGGKILRVKDDGSAPPDNPFNNLVYSYGHRNPQGLVWDNNGNLWATEHGRSGALSGFDELNLIEKGKNYGWPDIQGDQTRNGMQTPIINSGATKTWAPAGITYLNSALFFGGLRGEALYKVSIENKNVKSFSEYFTKEFGRIRDVVLGPDNMLYITTSNQDGRGTPRNADDKVIKVNPSKL